MPFGSIKEGGKSKRRGKNDGDLKEEREGKQQWTSEEAKVREANQ